MRDGHQWGHLQEPSSLGRPQRRQRERSLWLLPQRWACQLVGQRRHSPFHRSWHQRTCHYKAVTTRYLLEPLGKLKVVLKAGLNKLLNRNVLKVRKETEGLFYLLDPFLLEQPLKELKVLNKLPLQLGIELDLLHGNKAYKIRWLENLC